MVPLYEKELTFYIILVAYAGFSCFLIKHKLLGTTILTNEQ